MDQVWGWWSKRDTGDLVLLPYHHRLWSPTHPSSRPHSELVTPQTRGYSPLGTVRVLFLSWSSSNFPRSSSRSISDSSSGGVSFDVLNFPSIRLNSWGRSVLVVKHHGIEKSSDFAYLTEVMVKESISGTSSHPPIWRTFLCVLSQSSRTPTFFRWIN